MHSRYDFTVVLTYDQIHSSYASLGRDFKTTFDDLVKRLNCQQEEANALRRQILAANQELVAANQRTQDHLAGFMAQEQASADKEREALLTQITALIQSSADAQATRIDGQLQNLGGSISSANAEHLKAQESYCQGMDSWTDQSKDIVGSILKSRDSVKTKVKADFASANEHTTSLRQNTTSVHDSTVRIVADQMSHMDTQLQSLDHIVARVRAQNDAHHAAHVSSLSDLSSAVQTSYTSVGDHFATSFSRIQALGADMSAQTSSLQATLPTLSPESHIREPLRSLRDDINHQALLEYQPTGETPQRNQYSFPLSLPRTESHDILLSRLCDRSNSATDPPRSPSKGMVFADSRPGTGTGLVGEDEEEQVALLPSQSRPTSSAGPGLRELDVNALAGAQGNGGTTASSPITTASSTSKTPVGGKDASRPAMLKRQTTTALHAHASAAEESRLPLKKAARMTVAGLGGGVADRENLPAAGQDFSKSTGPGAGTRRGLRSGRST